jgi:hypothetical protein
MDWKVWKINPNWDVLRDLHGWIEVWSPAIQVKPLSSHEVGSIPEDQVPILLRNELEDVVALADGVAIHTIIY